MDMRLTHVRLLVEDVGLSAKFYRQVLDFDQTLDAGVYVELSVGDVLLGIYGAKAMAEVLGPAGRPLKTEDGDRVVLCIGVENVDDTYRELTARGVVFATEPHDQEAWVIRVAHMRDPDGNLIEISAPL